MHWLSVILLVLTWSIATTGCSTINKTAATFRDCAQCPQMVPIPTGSFTMGYDGGEPERYEGPLRNIQIIQGFAAGRFEVSNQEYADFVAATQYQSSQGCAVWDGVDPFWSDELDWRDPGYGRDPLPNEPVVCIDWDDTQAYVRWLAEASGQPYRLLSEAEWEYAARAGSTHRYAWGTDASDGCKQANMFDLSAAAAKVESPLVATPCDDGFPMLAPVGSLQPNGFGLFDTTGNVWEWVEDCYVMPYSATPTDGKAYLGPAGCDRHGVRGGSWITSGARQTVTFRGRDPATRTSQAFGFRVARSLTP